jgi:hypothetical protein
MGAYPSFCFTEFEFFSNFFKEFFTDNYTNVNYFQSDLCEKYSSE